MKKIFYLLALILIVSIGFLSARKTNAGFFDFLYTSKDQVVVSGNKILINGKETQLRGVGVGDPLYRDYDGRTDNDYKVIKDEWKANFVRLSIHPGDYKRKPKIMQKSIEEQVAVARKLGFIVVVDWHVIGVPNGWYRPPYDNNPYKQDVYDSNLKLAQGFWQYMAVEFRGDRGVIFEVWNEPKAENRDLAWLEIKPSLESFYNIIRAQGAQNIVLASGPHWTYDLRGIKNDPVKGNNIGYVWHNYPNNYRHASWDTALDELNEKYPIFLTEWGFSSKEEHKNEHFYNNGLNGFPNDMKAYILEKNLHSTAWCWHGIAGPNMLERNWTDLTEFGQFTKDFLIKFGNIEGIQNKINNYLYNGVDYNTTKLGEGERRAVLYSFEVAYGRYPESDQDYNDVIKIASGRWPEQTSWSAENRAKASFRYIYKREANMNNQNDNAAVTVMAYGLRQKAKNRNLNSERKGIIIFKGIYGRVPKSTEDWNIMQAITYSGAER